MTAIWIKFHYRQPTHCVATLGSLIISSLPPDRHTALKIQTWELYNNNYMMASTQITNTEIFAFIAVLVLKLLSFVFFINREDNKNLKSRLIFKKIANFNGKPTSPIYNSMLMGRSLSVCAFLYTLFVQFFRNFTSHYTLFIFHFFCVSLFSCSFQVNFSCVALFSCLTFFVLYSFSTALSSCCTLSMQHFFRIALALFFTVSFTFHVFFVLHFFQLLLFSC